MREENIKRLKAAKKQVRLVIEEVEKEVDEKKVKMLAYLYNLEKTSSGDLENLGFDDDVSDALEEISTHKEKRKADSLSDEMLFDGE